jgi:hypothetical protein
MISAVCGRAPPCVAAVSQESLSETSTRVFCSAASTTIDTSRTLTKSIVICFVRAPSPLIACDFEPLRGALSYSEIPNP